MPQPTVRDVHVDSLLTNIAVAYKQEVANLIADRVFPIVPVEKQSDKILKFTKDYWLRVQAGPRAPGTESRGGGFAIETTDTYFCDIHAFHYDVPLATFANADLPNLEQQVVEFVTWQLLLEREVAFATAFFDPTGKTPGVDFWNVKTAGTDFTAWDQANSDPIADIEKFKGEVQSLTGLVPNVLVLGPKAYQTLRLHPAIQAQVVYAPGRMDVKGLVTPELLAQLFDLKAVYVGRQYYSTTPEGATLVTQPVFGNHALLVYVPDRPGLLVPASGYIFEWTGYNSGYSVAISTIEMPHLKAIRYEGEMAYALKILGPDLGILLKNVCS